MTFLSAASAVGAHTLTLDRAVATFGVLVAVGGAAAGALAYSGRLGRGSATAALGAGILATAVAVWIVATADGGPGTGNGVVGGWVGLMLGPMAALLGALAPRRAAPSPADSPDTGT